jgi:hypothetical protein
MLEFIFPYITSYLIAQFILEDSFPDLPKDLRNVKYIGNGIVGLFIRYTFYFISEMTVINFDGILTIIGMFWIILKMTWCK